MNTQTLSQLKALKKFTAEADAVLHLLDRCKTQLYGGKLMPTDIELSKDLEATIVSERNSSKEQAKPQQEPVGEWVKQDRALVYGGAVPHYMFATYTGKVFPVGTKFYTSPQPLKPLSDEDIKDIAACNLTKLKFIEDTKLIQYEFNFEELERLVRAIEAKLGVWK